MEKEELATLPPFVICTSEFDFARRDAIDLASKLQELDLLKDFEDMDGSAHCYFNEDMSQDEVKRHYGGWKVMFEAFINK